MGKPERPTNIDELIVRTKAGDPSARDALLLYAQAYLRWKAGFEKATASRGKSDLGQDAMERALKAIATVPVSTADKFDGWLSSILINRVREVHRHETRGKRDNRSVEFIEDLDPEVTPTKQKSPSQNAATNEATVKLWKAIFELPKDQKRAVVRMQLDGLSVAEVADEMGKTPEAVAGLLQRGIAAIKAQLGLSELSVKRRTSRAERDRWARIIKEYSMLRNAGEKIDLESFRATHAPEDDDVRSFLEWLERISESKA
jgi:RNA polymerase sigma-70 factor, ECF subfamily